MSLNILINFILIKSVLDALSPSFILDRITDSKLIKRGTGNEDIRGGFFRKAIGRSGTFICGRSGTFICGRSGTFTHGRSGTFIRDLRVQVFFIGKLFSPSTDTFLIFSRFQYQNCLKTFLAKIFVFLCFAHAQQWKVKKLHVHLK